MLYRAHDGTYVSIRVVVVIVVVMYHLERNHGKYVVIPFKKMRNSGWMIQSLSRLLITWLLAISSSYWPLFVNEVAKGTRDSQPTVHSWGVQINALVVVVLVLVRVRMGDGGLAEQLSLLKLAR